MNVNAIPVFGWVLSLLAYGSMAVPFWLCWTVFGIGTKYFSFLPTVWQTIPFWECVGVFTCVSIARFVVFGRATTNVNVSKDSK